MYLHPSFSDAYSLSVAEAMGVGLPVIVSENTGNSEVILQNNLGLVFKTGDINDLYNKLSSINRTWLVEASERLRKVVPILSWDSYMERMITIYKELLNE